MTSIIYIYTYLVILIFLYFCMMINMVYIYINHMYIILYYMKFNDTKTFRFEEQGRKERPKHRKDLHLTF